MRFVDMHCHVLPGIDDGSESMEESLHMLRDAYKSGISEIIVTPHYKRGRRNAGRDEILRLIEQLQTEMRNTDNLITLYPGNEIFFFEGITEALQSGEVLTLNGTNRVLVEFSPGEQLTYLRNAIDSLLAEEYVPIVAHPERYGCTARSVSDTLFLAQMGAELQVNAGSVAGKYGREARKYTMELLKAGAVTYIGSDAHDARKRKIELDGCCKALRRKLDSNYLEAVMGGYAAELL